MNEHTPQTRVEATMEAIRADIVDGDLEPGSKLAVEHLRQRYGVSSSTIRESLSLLLPDGLVESIGQHGLSVAPISIDDLRDLSSTRTLLETHALRDSMINGDDEWEARVVAAFHRLSKAQAALDDGVPGAVIEWETRNRQFHEAITGACGSRWIPRILEMLHHHTERYRRVALTDTSVPRDVHAEHGALFEAVLARDLDGACELVARHIDRTTEVLATLHGQLTEAP